MQVALEKHKQEMEERERLYLLRIVCQPLRHQAVACTVFLLIRLEVLLTDLDYSIVEETHITTTIFCPIIHVEFMLCR